MTMMMMMMIGLTVKHQYSSNHGPRSEIGLWATEEEEFQIVETVYHLLIYM